MAIKQLGLFLLAMTACGSLSAQTVPALRFVAEAPPARPAELSIRPSASAGLSTEQWDRLGDEPIVRNVSTPSIAAFLPDPAKATGAAVVIAPGGGFQMLSIQSEGWQVGQWLADHGVAAFVLKYRLEATPRSEAAFADRMNAIVGGNVKTFPGVGAAADDAEQALRMVRGRAAQWHVDPHRIGLLGFSAGAMTALTVTLRDKPDAKPDFTGVLYGPMERVTVPPQAPPLFVALAADDPLFGGKGDGLVESWQDAHRPVEFHLFENGGHGFGMHHQGLTSDGWTQLFFDWMRDRHFLDASPVG